MMISISLINVLPVRPGASLRSRRDSGVSSRGAHYSRKLLSAVQHWQRCCEHSCQEGTLRAEPMPVEGSSASSGSALRFPNLPALLCSALLCSESWLCSDGSIVPAIGGGSFDHRDQGNMIDESTP
jgi:hypothetical protein